MHSGTVFWGTKDELRRIMTVMEWADAQVQMFEREEGEWTLHVNFAGAEVSRLALENGRLATLCAELTEALAQQDQALRGSTRLLRALNWLVQLKDGERDEIYHADKPRAWDEARAALKAVTDVKQ